MRGTKWRMPCSTPRKLTPSTQSQSSVAMFQTPSPPKPPPTPALLHRIWTLPQVSNAVSARRFTSASRITSMRTAIAVAPLARIEASAASSGAASISASTTFMPSWANRAARARPMPLAAPVTTAILPANSFIRPLSIVCCNGTGLFMCAERVDPVRSGRAMHVAYPARIFEFCSAMHGAAVVPHDEIAHPPAVGVDELALRGVSGQFGHERQRFGILHSPNPADVRSDVQRIAPAFGYAPHERPQHRRKRDLLFRREVGKAELAARINERMLRDQAAHAILLFHRQRIVRSAQIREFSVPANRRDRAGK